MDAISVQGSAEQEACLAEDEEHLEEIEKLEAMVRQVYDPKNRVFDDRRRRATDLKECARITLPQPLDTGHEAAFEMRRGTSDKVYNKYRQEECNNKGEVKQDKAKQITQNSKIQIKRTT